MTKSDVVLVWLEWPESCFHPDARSLACLREIVAPAKVVRVRTERAFLRELPRATHVIAWEFKSEWYRLGSRLRMVSSPSAGREFVSSEAPDGVRVHYGHFHGEVMAESVVAFVLALSRGFFHPDLGRGWPRSEVAAVCRRVAGTRAAVIGYGHVGRAIGEKLVALGVEVTGVTRHGLYTDKGLVPDSKGVRLRKVLKQCDWLVMALPGGSETANWLNAARIRQLPRSCVVCNVGRGGSVDEKALCAALSSGRLAGAFLDVRKREPTAPRLAVPGYEPKLDKLPNCFVMPHASAFYDDYLPDCFRELAKDGCFK